MSTTRAQSAGSTEDRWETCPDCNGHGAVWVFSDGSTWTMDAQDPGVPSQWCKTCQSAGQLLNGIPYKPTARERWDAKTNDERRRILIGRRWKKS